MPTPESKLQVEDLRVTFNLPDGRVQAVRGVDLQVPAGQTLAVVGESGCGKSVTMMALLGLLPLDAKIDIQGSVHLNGRQLIGLSERSLSTIRGRDAGVVFQDPMSALNPTIRVGDQVAESLRLHKGLSRRAAWKKAIEWLDRVGIPDPSARAAQYPFQFSGGMLQRATIAMGLACEPKLLIADEPTTALDVTTQSQVLALIKSLQDDLGMAVLFVTHDLGVVANIADEVAVMYAGEVVERGSVDDIFYRCGHPYTRGLRQALPDLSAEGRPLMSIPGTPPDLIQPPTGCGFASRCPAAMNVCVQQSPPEFLLKGSHYSRCWLQHPDAVAESQLYWQET